MNLQAIPLWAVFGLLSASLSATQMLLLEKFKTPPFPAAFWNKVACSLYMLPFVMATGLPSNPLFYALLATQSLLWVVSDVVFFKGVNQVGAGVIARLLPIGALISFLLWFTIDWHLAGIYAAMPIRSIAIICVFCLSAFFAWNLRSCVITHKALRLIWFTLCANIAGTLFTKLITQQTDISNGIFGYVFCESLIMITMWLIYYARWRPVPAQIMFGLPAIKTGLVVGLASSFTVATALYAFYHIDNPAYVGAVRYLNAVMIFFYNRAIGRANEGKLWAGFGIVTCAAMLVVLRG